MCVVVNAGTRRDDEQRQHIHSANAADTHEGVYFVRTLKHALSVQTETCDIAEVRTVRN